MMYADILVEVNALEKTFTYKVPFGMNAMVGMRALVPFGKRKLEGFILNIHDDGSYEYEVKEIISLIDDYPVINCEMLSLGKYISEKCMSSLISAYQTMLPSALKAKNKPKVNKKYLTYVKYINDENLKTEKQKELLSFIRDNDEVLKSSINQKGILNFLIDNGNVSEIKKEVYRIDKDVPLKSLDYPLTLEQEKVLNEVDVNKFKPYLLHGVTGSGKTYVYVKLIEEVLRAGKEAILLVPEISLTPQVVNIFKSHFGKVVAILHSSLSDGEKYDEWRKIERKEVSIVVGARSAIFAPFTNLGIIIVDEEHSLTYKQENNPRYSAIDIAIKRARTYNCPVIFGSATPSTDSYTRAKLGVYELLEMKERVNKNLPSIYLVDMKDEFKKGNRLFSSLATEKINDRLANGEQIIVLLNRRGFSTVVSCHECGYTHKCPNCDIPLTYHKKNNVMKCHYCDYQTYKLTKCPVCNSDDINYFGLGTEKLEEEINRFFPLAKTVRMDVDTTRGKNAHEKIIEAFRKQEYNVLVGTQMISKGLDFPLVTLVVVVNGDASLNIPDFRSAERTYELLSQVSGRAGRSSVPGEVIIQGFNMNHYSIVAAKNNDYLYFYNEEMKIRKVLKYPPFYNLCLIRVSGKDYDTVYTEASKISSYLKNNISAIVLGPTTSSMPKINNVYYVQIIIKYKKTSDVISHLKFISDRYKKGKIQLLIDLNPIKL
ncbi:MAG: primosomal protein N' [Bacilli bacterium]|nr:primosomal protein N' [Bacilli bacterium]